MRRTLLAQVASAVFLSSVAFAEDEARLPTWEDEIGKGFSPYHQLTVDDFRIDDKAHPEGSYWIKAFIHPYWRFVFTRRDWYYAYVDQWLVFSGLDKNESSRQSKEHDMQQRLPHAQAYLDLNEICARQLAALKPGELPSGRGATREEASKDLSQKMDAFLKDRYKTLANEADQFQKTTNYGANTKKVRELAKAIRKRLDAIPPPDVPAHDSPAPSSPSPSPSAKVR